MTKEEIRQAKADGRKKREIRKCLHNEMNRPRAWQVGMTMNFDSIASYLPFRIEWDTPIYAGQRSIGRDSDGKIKTVPYWISVTREWAKERAIA